MGSSWGSEAGISSWTSDCVCTGEDQASSGGGLTCGSSSQVGGCTVIGSSQPSPIGFESPLARSTGAGSDNSGTEGGTRGATGRGNATEGFSCGLWKKGEEENERNERVQTGQFEPKKVSRLLVASWVVVPPVLRCLAREVRNGLVCPMGWYPTKKGSKKTAREERPQRQEAPERDLHRRESRVGRSGSHLTNPVCRNRMDRRRRQRAVCPLNPEQARTVFRDVRCAGDVRLPQAHLALSHDHGHLLSCRHGHRDPRDRYASLCDRESWDGPLGSGERERLVFSLFCF